MSKNTKRLLIILVIALVFCVVGGAAAVGGLGLLADRFKNNVTNDPEKVRQMANTFATYKLPAGYTEQMGMDLLVYKIISFSTSDDGYNSKPLIILANFQTGNGMSPEEMSQQVQKSMEQQNGSQGMKLKLVETRKVTINGKETSLSVNEGTDSSGDSMRQWMTTYPGKTGLVMILIQGTTTDWDAAAYNEFLASLGN